VESDDRVAGKAWRWPEFWGRKMEVRVL